MTTSQKLEVADQLKAILDIDKTEYQRLQQEIYFRLNARTVLMRAQLTVTGLAGLILGPGAALLLSEEKLINLAMVLGIAVTVLIFSEVIYFEMINHDRLIGHAASYMHHVIRPRVQRITETPMEKIAGAKYDNSSATRCFGAFDWEGFLEGERQYLPTRRQSLWTWVKFFFKFDVWLRGQSVPILVAVVAWMSSFALIAVYGKRLWSCNLGVVSSCELVGKMEVPHYNGLLVIVWSLVSVSAFLMLPLFRGIGVHLSIADQRRRFSSGPS